MNTDWNEHFSCGHFTEGEGGTYIATLVTETDDILGRLYYMYYV